MTESPRLELVCFFFVLTHFGFIGWVGVWSNEHWQKLAIKALTPWEGLEAQTHTLPAPLEGESGGGGCSTDSCMSGGETFRSHALFSICFYCGGRVRLWRTWWHTVFVCTLREARIICMVCYKLSRAVIASAQPVFVRLQLYGDFPGPPPPTRTHGSSLKYEKSKLYRYKYKYI